MSALTISAIIFLSTLGGIFLGALLRHTLPKHHLNEHAKDVVRLGREEMRSTLGPFADRLWREKEAITSGPFETDGAAERVDFEIQKLSPHDAVQLSLQARSVQISNDLAQVRFLLFPESENLVPNPFLAVLAFWLVIIFASFSPFSPLTETVFACLSLFAFLSACGIFLILELSRPFTELLRLSSAPLRNDLGTI